MQYETSSIKMDLDQCPIFRNLAMRWQDGKKRANLIVYKIEVNTLSNRDLHHDDGVMIKGTILYGLMCSGYACHHSILGHTFYTHVFAGQIAASRAVGCWLYSLARVL